MCRARAPTAPSTLTAPSAPTALSAPSATASIAVRARGQPGLHRHDQSSVEVLHFRSVLAVLKESSVTCKQRRGQSRGEVEGDGG